ncbi:F-box only protein 43-like [Seriola lalandi dorsalis]|uniref:F-box only protein 43-like n=1 Tax=Seriola lalandi dorsalis TaxID=1841481 RepID=UPI000C6FADDF|nr:F-box only protein 43-like [Seriola lalandi dorsalis]
MPLAGLIGRKMGLGKMDILTELKKRSLRHILAVILSHLTSEGIYRCGRVCKSWNEIIQHNKQANFRRRNHLSELKATLELGGAVHVPDAETRLTLLKRSALKTVQAQSRTSSYCTPQSANSTLIQLQHSAAHSGGSSSKREKFLEKHTLASDDVLAHFFNDFLSLPSFSEALQYNQETGLFEVCLDREQGIQWIMEERFPFFLQSDYYIEYRFLVLMRSRYLLSSSRSSLNTELLSRLELKTSPCWTEEKLCSVQPCLTEALLYYW